MYNNVLIKLNAMFGCKIMRFMLKYRVYIIVMQLK